MSTRQRKNPQHSAKDLPPPRDKKALRSVSKPLSNTRLTSLVYVLAGLALFFAAFYTYRITQWKADAGGWWNLALGKRPPQMRTPGAGTGVPVGGRSKKGDVEDHINSLAKILGMPPMDLASAISGVVKEHVAPATLSSISSSASAAGAKKTAVAALVGDEGDASGEGGTVAGMASMMDSIVGLDEPMGLE